MPVQRGIPCRSSASPDGLCSVPVDHLHDLLVNEVVRFFPRDALPCVLATVLAGAFEGMQDAVVVVDHLLCSQAPQAQASLVVRVFRIALDVVDDAVLHVHQQSAVLMASWAGACVGPDDGHAVFFPGPFPTGRVVLGRRVLGFFLDEEGAVDVGFDLVFDFGLRFCHDGCPLSFLSMSARADEACRRGAGRLGVSRSRSGRRALVGGRCGHVPTGKRGVGFRPQPQAPSGRSAQAGRGCALAPWLGRHWLAATV